jgi:hypothetical protein
MGARAGNQLAMALTVALTDVRPVNVIGSIDPTTGRGGPAKARVAFGVDCFPQIGDETNSGKRILSEF